MAKFKREITVYEDEYEYSVGYYDENGFFKRILTFDHNNYDYELHESVLNSKEFNDLLKLLKN